VLRRCRPLLGTFVEIQADSEAAIEAGYAAIAEAHRLMSAHEPDSDLSRVNCFAHLGPVQLHPWTALVLERALFWAKESEGAFDPVRAGKAAIESGYLPRHPGQPEPAAAHWSWLELQGRSVRLLKPGCIDLGGIAKGFAVDRAIEALRRAGSERGLVNAGGDMAAFGAQPWRVAIADPVTSSPRIEIALANEALATSAMLDGGWAHLPGADRRWLSASVRTRSAMDADALTKVLLSGSARAHCCLDLAPATGLRIACDGSIEEVSREMIPA
jgi:thiamine biosynthesis lipoprotein